MMAVVQPAKVSKKTVSERIRRTLNATVLRKEFLRLREGEIGQGRLPALKAERTTFEELAGLFLQDYRSMAGRPSRRKTFGQFRACRMTSEHIRAHIIRRQSEEVANGTINRELAALKRMYRLASQQTPPLVITTPHIPHLQENNVRQGFFTEEEYKVLRGVLPDHVKVPLIIAYWTGMRAGEILKLQWDQLDLERGLLRLDPGTTKNNRGRLVPLVKEVTESLWQWKQHVLAHYPACRWVCHYRGKRLRAVPTKSWKKACERVGLNGKLFHDLRRTAIRNMVRLSISERIAMEISGHRTRFVFDRYDIVSEADIRHAGALMNQVHRVRPDLSFETTREWHAGSCSATHLAPSEHNGEHSARAIKSREELAS